MTGIVMQLTLCKGIVKILYRLGFYRYNKIIMIDDVIQDAGFVFFSIPFPSCHFYHVFDIVRKQPVGSLYFAKWDFVLEMFSCYNHVVGGISYHWHFLSIPFLFQHVSVTSFMRWDFNIFFLPEFTKNGTVILHL